MAQEQFSREDVTIRTSDSVTVLSIPLIIAQKLTRTEVEHIKCLHKMRMEVEQQMREAPTRYILQGFNSLWRDVQFLLQDAWKFPRDERRHRFWEVPRCSCPKMDNGENYPSGYKFVNQDCEVHGG